MNVDIFSPKNFDEYVGQPQAKKLARIMVSAALLERRPVPNILIDGSYGLGKTALAKVIQYEYGTKTPLIIDASTVNKSMPSFARPVIIDEIHNLDPVVADSLNIYIDNGLAKIIGCTTNPGALPAPFRSRFRNIHLEYYTAVDIQKILELAVQRKGFYGTPNSLSEIAKRSRLNPRVALNYLAFIFDLMTVNGHGSSMPTTVISEAFKALAVDTSGFTARDYAYMAALPVDRPVGIQYLSSVLGIDAKTIEVEIEPFLLQTRHIDRMPRGRVKLKEL